MAPAHPVLKKSQAEEKKRTNKITARKFPVSPGVSATIDSSACTSLDSEESLHNDKHEK